MGVQRRIQLNPDLKIEQLVKEIIHSPESQIIIEIPNECLLLTNEINLRLIKFYAEEEEKEILIQTGDPVLISLSQRLGITTIKELQMISEINATEPEHLESFQQAEAEIAAAPEEKTRSIKMNPRYGRLIPSLFVILFSLFIALWWFLQPKAMVMVYPKEKNLSFNVPVQISTAFSDSDILAGKIPVQNLEKQAVVITQTMPTGYKTIGVTPAIGKILLINSTNQPVVVPKGTVLIGREGERFLTDKEVLVPKKAPKFQSGIAIGEDYGRAEIGITAEKKGISGNQPAKTISKIDGKYQSFLKVANPSPTRNGTDKKVTVVTLEDVKKGEAEVKRQMQLAAIEEVRTLINQNYLYLADLIKPELIRISNKPEIGEEANSLQTELEYRVSILAPTLIDIQKYLNTQFERNIPINFEAENHRLRLVSAKVISMDEEFAQLEITAQGEIRGILNQAKIRRLIQGKNLNAAKEILTSQSEIADFKININNQGTKLPNFGFQIKVLFPAGKHASNHP